MTLDRPAIPRLYGPLHVRVFLGVLLVLFFMTAAKNTSPAGIVMAIANGFKDFCHKNNIVFYDKLMYRLKYVASCLHSYYRDGAVSHVPCVSGLCVWWPGCSAARCRAGGMG